MATTLKHQAAGILKARLATSRAIVRTSSHISRRQSIYGISVVLLATAIAVALTVQGWRSRTPAFDLLTYIHSVRDFLATGALPQHGDTGSYGSFKPPGTAWLMLPSALLFEDARLSEYVGTAFLHFATLVGLFLLGRKYFGTWCACFAVVLYGLSDIGLFLAGSLWPNGRPDFFIWTVYLASQWVTRRDAKYLAAAVAVWGIGMHVDMGVTPAILILPALWLIYRPSVRVKPLLMAAALILIVWYPYIRFEAPRAFADLRSQLLFVNILPANYRDTWCDQTLTLRKMEYAAGESASIVNQTPVRNEMLDPVESVLTRAANVVNDRLLSNFLPIAPIPGSIALSVLLMLMVIAALVLYSVSGAPAETRRQSTTRRWLTPILIGAILSGLLVSEVVIPRIDENLPLSIVSVIQRLDRLLLLGGTAFLAGKWAAAIANRSLMRAGLRFQTKGELQQRRAMVLSLAVPWFVLFVVAESGKPERFWWLWPLQVMFLAAFATNLLPRLGASRWIVGVTQAALVLVLLGNSFLLSRVDAWHADGWSGRDAHEVQVVDYVAGRLDAEERSRAAIGYHLFIYRFMATYNITNPQYKVGADFDLLFKYRHGIANTDTCAEGLSPRDEFRIVRTTPMKEDWAPREYFDVPLDNGFVLVRRFGPYELFERRLARGT